MTAAEARRSLLGRELVVLRHAKSAYPVGVPDHDRPLAERGCRDAPAAGRWLREHVGGVDLVVVSSATRTQQTWSLVASELDPPGAVVTEPRVYLASAEDLLAVLRDTDDGVGRLLLVGHNPGCEDLALLLAGAAEPDAAARLALKYPTAAIAVLTFDGPWASLAPGAARLATFAVPRG